MKCIIYVCVLKFIQMAHTLEQARLSGYGFSSIVNGESKGKYLFDTITHTKQLAQTGKGKLYFSGFATPERCQLKPELLASKKFPCSERLSPGEALAVQALGDEIFWLSNRVGLSELMDSYIRKQLDSKGIAKVGLIDFTEGMAFFGSELLNVADLREQMSNRKNHIPDILLKRYQTPLDLNRKIIKWQVLSSIVDFANEKVEQNIESSYHLSRVGPGDERNELLKRIKSRQEGIKFATLIYEQILNVAFQEEVLYFLKKNLLQRDLPAN